MNDQEGRSLLRAILEDVEARLRAAAADWHVDRLTDEQLAAVVRATVDMIQAALDHAGERQVWCENCHDFAPLDDEGGPHADALNPYPWHDLICGRCRSIIASIRIVSGHAATGPPPEGDREETG